MAELKKKVTTKTLLEKIPAETCWLITAQALTRLSVLIGSKTMPSVLGKGEGIISPLCGWEKWIEILTKVYSEVGMKFYPHIKETFNISIEDAVGSQKLHIVAWVLLFGPEMRSEIGEATRERTVVRWSKCAWDERFKELEVDPALRGACNVCEVMSKEGLKTVNPKLTFKLTKTMGWRDPYCEAVIEFKEE